MDDDSVSDLENAGAESQKSWADRNPKLSILLIAGVFYIILFGMCGLVLVLLLRG